MSFPSSQDIGDLNSKFGKDLVRKLTLCDYLSFNDFFKIADQLISDAITNVRNSCQSPKEAIVTLCGGHGSSDNNNNNKNNNGSNENN